MPLLFAHELQPPGHDDVLQQRPSTQFPEMHWLPPEHVLPSALFETHVPPEQYWLEVQMLLGTVLLLVQYRQLASSSMHSLKLSAGSSISVLAGLGAGLFGEHPRSENTIDAAASLRVCMRE